MNKQQLKLIVEYDAGTHYPNSKPFNRSYNIVNDTCMSHHGVPIRIGDKVVSHDGYIYFYIGKTVTELNEYLISPYVSKTLPQLSVCKRSMTRADWYKNHQFIDEIKINKFINLIKDAFNNNINTLKINSSEFIKNN